MKSTLRILSLLLAVLLLTACSAKPAQESTQSTTTVAATEAKPEGIRNIIIIIGDGMGDAQVEAGELASGKNFVFHDWQRTHSNTNSLKDGEATQTTDSAAGGTALATGQLTTNGRLALGPDSNEDLQTILDHAKQYGKATGVVTTDAIYGATPASFSGHAVSRDDSMTIMLTQLQSGIDLFCANSTAEALDIHSNITGAGYEFVNFFSNVKKCLEAEKAYWLLNMGGSSASDKLEKVIPYSLDFLDKDPDGFVMMVEQAHIDKYCHSNEMEGTEICSNSLNNTVEAILTWLDDRDDTAIIITADHETGGLHVSADAIYEKKYTTNGNTFYYEYTSEAHTPTPVSVYFYGFTPDLTPYYIDEEQTLVKNISVFSIMLDLLQNPVQNEP